MPTNRDSVIATPFGQVPVSFRFDVRAHDPSVLRFDTEDIEDYVDYMLQPFPKIRNDAAGSAAFARGLEYIFKEVLKVQYPALRATDFIPLNTEVPAGSLTATYRMYQQTGRAAVIHNYASDLPAADIGGKEWQSPIVTIGSSYNFSIVDVQRAAILDIPLEQMKADAARFAIDFLGEQVAAIGLPSEGITGLTNATGITATTQVSTGTWLAQIAAIAAATPTTPWSAVAAVSGIVSDINAMTSGVRTKTLGLHEVTTVLFPTVLWSALKAVPRSPSQTDDTLMDYISKICDVDTDHWPQLNNAGGDGFGRVMAYKKDPQVLRLIQAQPFTQLPPQPRNLAWQVPCLAQLGGVNVMVPAAVTYMDNLAGV